jgi:hypothetical protein
MLPYAVSAVPSWLRTRPTPPAQPELPLVPGRLRRGVPEWAGLRMALILSESAVSASQERWDIAVARNDAQSARPRSARCCRE